MIICPRCKHRYNLKTAIKSSLFCVCGEVINSRGTAVSYGDSPPPPRGPGTELTAIFAEFGIKPKASCGCKAKAATMDVWGVEGCKEHRSEILEWMKEAYDTATWTEKAIAGWNAINKGLPLTLEGILALTIERAEAKAAIIKVAFLTPGLTCGGAERWILSLCQNFDMAKVWPIGIGVELKANSAPMMVAEVPKHTRLVYEWEACAALARQADILIVWGAPNMIELARKIGKPFIVVVHGSDEASSYGGTIARKGIEAGGISACVNEACLKCYHPEYRDKVTVIANGADEERIKFTRPRFTSYEEQDAKCYLYDQLGIPRMGQKVLLYLGRAMRDKRIDMLGESLQYLPKIKWSSGNSMPKWICVAIGDTDSFGRAQIEKWGIHHIPSVNDVGNFLAAADVQILLSDSEAHPLSITEGWLAGIPTVTSELPWIESIHRQHGPMSWLVGQDYSPMQAAGVILEADAAGRNSEQVIYAKEVAEREYTAKAMAARWGAFIVQAAQSAPALQ